MEISIENRWAGTEALGFTAGYEETDTLKSIEFFA